MINLEKEIQMQVLIEDSECNILDYYDVSE